MEEISSVYHQDDIHDFTVVSVSQEIPGDMSVAGDATDVLHLPPMDSPEYEAAVRRAAAEPDIGRHALNGAGSLSDILGPEEARRYIQLRRATRAALLRDARDAGIP